MERIKKPATGIGFAGHERVTVHTQCFDNNSNFTKVLEAERRFRLLRGHAEITQEYPEFTMDCVVFLVRIRARFGRHRPAIAKVAQVDARVTRMFARHDGIGETPVKMHSGAHPRRLQGRRHAMPDRIAAMRVARGRQPTRRRPQAAIACDHMPMKSFLPISTPLWRRIA